MQTEFLIEGRRATVTLKRITAADPAAGVEVSVTVTALKYWELIAVYLPCVQGITQTPLPILQIDDGANVIAEFAGSSAAQVVSSTTFYTWGVDLPLSGQVGATPNTRSTGALPVGLILPPGYRVRTSTQGLGANTDYGVASLFVAEYA